jgi:hypothetical protein
MQLQLKSYSPAISNLWTYAITNPPFEGIANHLTPFH